MERNFKGIWIPKKVWENKNLSCLEKCLLAEINSLSLENSYMNYSEYFCEFFNVSIDDFNESINKLIELNFLTNNENPVIPTIDEVRAFIKENNFKLNADFWYDYYSKKEFKTKNGNILTDWKKNIIYWENNSTKTNPKNQIKALDLKNKKVEEMTNKELDIVFNHNILTDPRHQKYHSHLTDEEIEKQNFSDYII